MVPGLVMDASDGGRNHANCRSPRNHNQCHFKSVPDRWDSDCREAGRLCRRPHSRQNVWAMHRWNRPQWWRTSDGPDTETFPRLTRGAQLNGAELQRHQVHASGVVDRGLKESLGGRGSEASLTATRLDFPPLAKPGLRGMEAGTGGSPFLSSDRVAAI